MEFSDWETRSLRGNLMAASVEREVLSSHPFQLKYSVLCYSVSLEKEGLE